MVKVLLIGNGAREHAIAEAVMRSNKKPELYAFMSAKNPGIAKLAKKYAISNLSDFNELETFCKKTKPDFAVIGPEMPLEKGVVDFLETLKIPSLGPKKELAKLETSKSFTRALFKKYDIPGSPKLSIFNIYLGIKDFMKELDYKVVIKPDGLTGGKGVKVFGEHLETEKEALDYCMEIINSQGTVVIEEKLEGEEFSVQFLTDGKTVLATPAAQDHKRAFFGDNGPNTGGMGSYSCSNHLLPFLTQKDVDEAQEITKKVADALYKETGQYYKGVMYGGFMITKDGVKLIEYNARFADPEAMNVLPIMKTDFIEVCEAIINSKLDEIKLEFEARATVCKYIVPQGYPENPVKNEKIALVDVPEDAKVYYASVDERDDGLYMSSSRAIAFVGIDKNIEKAEDIAQQAVSCVKGRVFFRADIGTKELIKKRIKHMEELRKK